MAFTIDDYHDLVQLLREHPEWQKELRQLLLPDELLALPEIVQQLALAQQRTEERLVRLEETVQRLVEQVEVLVEGQKRIIERVSSLEGRVGSLEEGQKRLEEGQKQLIQRVDLLEEGQKQLIQRVDLLEEGQKQLIQRVDSLEEGQKELKDTVGGIKGDMLEMKYRDRAYAYFGTLLSQAEVKELRALESKLKTALTPDEFNDLLLLDLLVTGKLEYASESLEVFLAIEVSSVVDKNDVSRAVHRASLLRKAGYHVVPAVAGEDVTQGASEAIREYNVLLVQDGRMEFGKEAVASWLNILLDKN